MTCRTAPLIFAALLLLLPPLAGAGEDDHHGGGQPKAHLALSPDLKDLLAREMGAIQDGVKALVPALASGEWGRVAEIGKQIKASYILKQALTPAQKKELHRVLPPDFIERDQAFHKYSGMLAHAAEKKNADVAAFYFYKLNEACMSCHAKYAPERFPALAETGGNDGH